jgi:tRNA-specific 2-thiouridylase
MNSLGFDKDPRETRIVVAMSGGVDSSVTAALLAEQGYDVVGVTLQLYDHGMAVQRKGACCAGQDIYDARQVAEKIGIPHYILDYENKFSQSVMDDFADSYMRGETPIPCVRCNQRVKFRDMLDMARDLGAEAMATGHYVQRVMGAHGAELHRAADDSKDQSYFLFTTTQPQLDFLRFPLGGMNSKTETRALAERFNLPVAAKPDSQDICFVPNGDYASVVAKLRPGGIDAGDIVDEAGTVLGRHEGIIHFTIGQRKGITVTRGGEKNEPLYVLRLDADKHQVIVGPKESLAQSKIHLREINWLAGEVPADGMAVTAKLRSAQAPVAANFKMQDGQGVLTLAEPIFGIAPGQAGVIYDGARVLGGGWISAH